MIWLLSGLSAYCFWVAGRGKNDFCLFAPKVLRNKRTKKFGCSICLLVGIWLLLGFRLSLWAYYTLVFWASFGLVGTYHDYLGKKGILPNGEEYQEETLPCWIMTGLGYGLVALPLLWAGVSWQLIALRTIALMIAIPLIRKIPSVHIQEAGSGFLYLISLKLLTY